MAAIGWVPAYFSSASFQKVSPVSSFISMRSSGSPTRLLVHVSGMTGILVFDLSLESCLYFLSGGVFKIAPRTSLFGCSTVAGLLSRFMLLAASYSLAVG